MPPSANAFTRPNALTIYYIHPLIAGPLPQWADHLKRARGMGFSHVCVGPIFAPQSDGNIFLTDDPEGTNSVLQAAGSADDLVAHLASLCREFGLQLILDVVMDRFASGGTLARSAPKWFRDASATALDPREALPEANAVYMRFDEPEYTRQLEDWWVDRLVRLVRAGVSGFRLLGLQNVPGSFLASVLPAVRQETDNCIFLAWTPGMPWSRLPGLGPIRLDGVFSSLAWWDGHAPWFAEEHNTLRPIAAIIGVVEVPFGERLAARRSHHGPDPAAVHRRWLRIAAATGRGLFVPIGFEFASRHRLDAMRSTPEEFEVDRIEASIDLTEDIRAANALADGIAAFGATGEMQVLTSPSSTISALLTVDAADARAASQGMLVLINTSDDESSEPLPISIDPLDPAAGTALGSPRSLDGGDPRSPLAGGEVRLVSVTRTKQVVDRGRKNGRALNEAAKAPRVVVENVTPRVDGGPFAVKRIVGQTVTVSADVYTDGHDLLRAELLWRAIDEKDWVRSPLAPLGNDRWQAAFTPTRMGRHVFTVEAWRDEFGTLCRDIQVKLKAGVDVTLELTEARQHLEALLARSASCTTSALVEAIEALRVGNPDESVQALVAPRTQKAVAAAEERAFLNQHPPIILDVERPQAEFASWYELFPRSQSGDPTRHGTFSDVIGRLPDIRAMGFDVLYFPPIHPIGITNRKGRNNSLVAGPDDPGSPYAIGGREGGHDAIHPQLGTLSDFRRLVAAASDHGLEIALDFAIQCSPDHPWLRDHPNWFRWRSDGSMKFAENPPKKYEDIVNVDFYLDSAIPELWLALRDIVLFWADEGVRIFRVDNPHTKPLPFWQWMIGEVRGRHPDIIFLAEAFTRPKMMYRLAKIGFSQSYTYFTWRNTKRELTEYLTELSTTEVKEFFRPHFFVNTPDINPFFLQTSGRPGFLIRAVLAATLSGLWGVYAGFEQCEAAALQGREEYLDAEKYEIRVRDQNAPGNIVADTALLNRIRKANPALHSHLGVTFYNAFNDQILLYGKMSQARDEMILIAVNLDPRNPQEATFELPLWEWKLPDHGSLFVEDVVRGYGSVWTGKLQQVRLDPAQLPFAIWRVTPTGART